MAKKNSSPNPSSKPSSDPKELCFVIMPFGGWLDDYYESIYCPAIESTGLEPHRADDLFRPSTIVNDIWAYTKNAKLLVADLSGKNPNVFYELGLAHALAKPVILIAENMDEIPFDLRALRIIVYDKNAPDWGAILKSKIESSIKEVLKTPAEAVLPAFLNVKNIESKQSVTPQQKEIIEIKQELDLLRKEMRTRDLPSLEMRTELDNITPDEARAMIKEFLQRGFSDGAIVRKLIRLGPPEPWILENISSIRRELKQKKSRLLMK